MKIVMLAPGDDPTRNRKTPKGPSLSGCLIKAAVIGAVVAGGLWLFFQTQQPLAVAELPTGTSSSTASPTRTAEFPTLTPAALPTDTPVPTATLVPTTTGMPSPTPPWYGCSTENCRILPGAPGYDPTYAVAMYETQVAPLTPTATRTRVPARINTPRPAARKVSGSGGSVRAQPQAQAQPRVQPTAYATYWLPPVAATDAPTSPPPLPLYCVPGSTWANWGVEGATPYVITLTPLPECIRTPGAATPTGTATVEGSTPVPQVMQ